MKNRNIFHYLNFIFLLLISFSIIPMQLPWQQVPYWNWDQLQEQTSWQYLKNFFAHAAYKGFRWGVGDSAFQTEGTKNTSGHIQNNWTEWLKQKEHSPVGVASDRWENYKKDIDQVVALGFDSYRMSIEMAKIMPSENQLDQEAMEHYREVCEYAKQKKLRLSVCLWHHTWPLWFDQKGGWEKRENNKYFQVYTSFVVSNLRFYVDTWIPLNEPDGYAMQGYFRGEYPPGKKSLQLAGEVITNMLDAHVKASTIIKELAPNSKITITKVVQHIDPYRWWHPLEYSSAALFNYLFNTAFINFFKDGKFVWYIPGWVNVSYENKQASASIDYFGINYYSHSNIKFTLLPKPSVDPRAAHPWEIVTDNGHVLYAEGLYRAIKACSVLNKPMAITENGVADKQLDDQNRQLYMRRHLYALARVLQEKFNVIEYDWWTLKDNFEWMHGYDQKFGLINVDHTSAEKTSTPRASAQQLSTFLHAVRPLEVQK